MRRSIWLNALLAAAVAALGAWVYFKPAGDAPVQHPLSALKPAEAASLHIERPGAPPITLEKKAGAWRMTAPFAARADEPRVQRLIGILAAWSAHRLAAADLARFELDQPQARVTIDKQAFSFGMVSPVAHEQYVLANGAVFAVNPRYGAALPANAGEMASPRLFGPGETPARIETRDFTVEQHNGKWRQSPEAKDASQDDFARWADEWRRATATRVEPYVKDMPQEVIRIRLKEGGTLALGVRAREPELVLVRPGEMLQYYYRPELAKRLLSPPNAAREERAAKK